MIERWMRSELNLKRWQRFKSLKRAVISTWVLVLFTFLSLTAEIWVNDKPIVMGFKSSIYFPIFHKYHPSEFAQEGVVTDYRSLDLDWSVWPIVRWSPFESNKTLATYPAPPSSKNWFGTDDRGRDVLARLVYGFRYSVGFAVCVWFISLILGIIAGSTMGFVGGKTDIIGSRVVETFESLPYLLMLLTLVAFLGASMPLLIGFASLLGWMRISNYVRAEFLRLRNREFVQAARAQGLSRTRIIFKHILPNALGPIITLSPAEIASYVYSLTILDFLGVGLPPPTPSWGELLQQAQNYFSLAWWLAFYPSLAMILTLSAFTFVGEGIRRAFDPHYQPRM